MIGCAERSPAFTSEQPGVVRNRARLTAPARLGRSRRPQLPALRAVGQLRAAFDELVDDDTVGRQRATGVARQLDPPTAGRSQGFSRVPGGYVRDQAAACVFPARRKRR
jgi:hypothetical protein